MYRLKIAGKRAKRAQGPSARRPPKAVFQHAPRATRHGAAGQEGHSNLGAGHNG